jgi:RNA polymerase sigma factor (sigma-70 family)
MAGAKGQGKEALYNADLAQVLIETRRDVIRFLTMRLRCSATAEDIAQDIVLRLLASEQAPRQPRRLIFTAAVNLARNHVRDQQRRSNIHQKWIRPFSADREELTPERTAVARDMLERLAIELAGWPMRTREIFILNRFDGLSQREISRKLCVSTKTIENHMMKAIISFNRWVEQQRL